MDLRKNILFRKIQFNESEQNTEEQIKIAEGEVNYKFPNGYIQIIKQFNGGSGDIGDNYINLWTLEDVVEFYEDISDPYLSELVVFASDGCGMGYGFSKTDDGIRIVPMDSLEFSYSKRCSNNFDEFLDDLFNNRIEDY